MPDLPLLTLAASELMRPVVEGVATFFVLLLIIGLLSERSVVESVPVTPDRMLADDAAAAAAALDFDPGKEKKDCLGAGAGACAGGGGETGGGVNGSVFQ